MSYFEECYARLVRVEGGYSNNKNDAGGATRYGITEAVAREDGYTGDMKDLPLERAKSIYKRKYWDINKLDEISGFSRLVADEMLDTGVNCGPGVAAEFLQRSLNSFNRRGKDYADVKIDGSVGPSTLIALHTFLTFRGTQGEVVLMRALNALQGARYIHLGEMRQANEDFEFGWFLNRVV